MRYEANRLTLSTGRSFYASRGILGIGPSDDTIFEGYDVEVSRLDKEDECVDFSPAERLEIAEEMIRRWQTWANAKAGADA